MDDKILLGCCGAYCKTCKLLAEKYCKGCKIGYSDKSRDLSKAKCKMKICCISKGLISCADCKIFEACEILQTFFNKKGYKYKKYKEAIYFIKSHGYNKFFDIANNWNMQYGKYK